MSRGEGKLSLPLTTICPKVIIKLAKNSCPGAFLCWRAKMERVMREELKTELERFKARYPVDPAVRGRIAKPPVDFIGEEVLDLAVAALLHSTTSAKPSFFIAAVSFSGLAFGPN